MSLSAQSSRPSFSSFGSGLTAARAVFCEECDSPISAKRLAAVPGARYCRDCQSSAEAIEDRDAREAAAAGFVHRRVHRHHPKPELLAAIGELDGGQHRVGGDSSAYGVGL